MVLGLTIAFVLLAVCGELLLRLFGHTLVYEQDDLLGWRPRAQFSAHYMVGDQSGEAYVARYATVQNGFRAYGSTAGPRKRVLFVGDSFTADPNTSNEEAYFNVVGQRLPVEVFAIGAGGYGTLQELMLVQPWLERIKPDVLVLQYCTNDLADNSLPLEGRTSHVRNQKNLRPYRMDDGIVYRLPRYHPYRLLYNHSRLFRKLDIEIMMLQYRFDDPTKRVGAEAQAVAADRVAAVSLTTQLMTQLSAAMPAGTRKLSISCDTSDAGETSTWQTMALSAGLTPEVSVSAQVEAAGIRGQLVRTRDLAHWNRLGNRIAGEELARVLALRYLDPVEVQP